MDIRRVCECNERLGLAEYVVRRRANRPHRFSTNDMKHLPPAFLVMLCAASFPSLGAQETATAVVYSESLQLMPSQPVLVSGVGDETVYFSTFNGTAGAFLIDTSQGNTISGELRPRAGAPGLYEGAYGIATPLVELDYGSYVVTVPTTDTGGFGLPDVLQYAKAGSFSATGSGYDTAAGGATFSISFSFARSAGSASGTYVGTTTSLTGQMLTVTGTVNLDDYKGSVIYTRGTTNSLSIALTNLADSTITLSGATTYTVEDSNNVSYPAFVASSSTGANYYVLAGTMARTGKNYLGQMQLVDGLPNTYWADFTGYRIVLTDNNNTSGDGIPDFTDALPTAPSISAQPVAQNAVQGGSVTFSVTASGGQSYQWSLNGSAIAGATSSSLTIANVQSANAGNYTVTVTNGAGSTTSIGATLSVTSVGGQVFFTDTFPGPLLNTANWSAYAPVAGATVAVSNGLILTDGGAVLIQNSVPTDTEIDLSFAFTGSAYDSFKVDTRSDGSFLGNSGQFAQGIRASFRIRSDPSDPAGTSNNVELDDESASSGQTVLGTATFPLLQGQTYSVRIIENETSVSLFINDFSNPILKVATTKSYGGKVGLNNRAGAAAGSSISDGSQVTIKSFSVSAAAPAPGYSTTRLVNISTRAMVGTGSNILIPGFVVSGNGQEVLLIRAVGPGLAGFGVTGVLTQPSLALYNSSGSLIAANSGWGSSAQIVSAARAVGAFDLPAGSADCALLISLAPGAYTVQVSSVGGTTGVALAEIYEVSSSGTRLANISTRAQVGTGANIIIPGFVITGVGSEQLLVRADGPALSSFGVTGVLAQPSLTVLDNTGKTIAANAGWGTGTNSAQVSSAATHVGAFALQPGSGDSAQVISLSAGAYTMQIAGVNNTTGVALAEVYEDP